MVHSQAPLVHWPSTVAKLHFNLLMYKCNYTFPHQILSYSSSKKINHLYSTCTVPFTFPHILKCCQHCIWVQVWYITRTLLSFTCFTAFICIPPRCVFMLSVWGSLLLLTHWLNWQLLLVESQALDIATRILSPPNSVCSLLILLKNNGLKRVQERRVFRSVMPMWGASCSGS